MCSLKLEEWPRTKAVGVGMVTTWPSRTRGHPGGGRAHGITWPTRILKFVVPYCKESVEQMGSNFATGDILTMRFWSLSKKKIPVLSSRGSFGSLITRRFGVEKISGEIIPEIEGGN